MQMLTQVDPRLGTAQTGQALVAAGVWRSGIEDAGIDLTARVIDTRVRKFRAAKATSVAPRFLLGPRPDVERASAIDPVLLESELEPTPVDKLQAKLLEYTSLPAGWDGASGQPANRKAYEDACEFLKHLQSYPELPLPRAQISPDGELGLYWRKASIFADVGFYGDGTLSFYAEAPEEEHGADDWPVSRGLPPGLIRTLEAV